MSIFAIEYPITRPIRWRWIARLSYAGSFFVIAVLAVLNVALVGYETVNIFQSDFNATQKLWYHRFVPYSKREPQCEPHLLNIGDQFRIYDGSLEWTILSIRKDYTTASGFPYRGSRLTACDVTMMMAEVDLTRSLRFQGLAVILECLDVEGYTIKSSTPFTAFSADQWKAVDQTLQLDLNSRRMLTLADVFNKAAQDLEAGLDPDITGYNTLSVITKPCSSSLTTEGCALRAPEFNCSVFVINRANEMHLLGRPLDRKVDARIWNLLHTIYAITRVDLGFDTPNNFLLHREALPLIITRALPSSSDGSTSNSILYQHLQNTTFSLAPATGQGSAIKAEYLCKHQRLKSPGSLFISVLVAVLSMFSGIWTVYMWILSTLAKESERPDTVIAHADRSYPSLEAPVPECRDKMRKWEERFEEGRNRRYGRRPSFLAGEIAFTALHHSQH